ncbi:sensor histidine kinase [Nonomuraea sp. NPDC050394]|uniref:sensor histidine kinase n=1 Tax=Nonomuraea sp. NPDC050394 TaxID=3364363 RepID=UPI00379DA2DA
MIRAGKLDRIRWLFLYSNDFINLTAFLSLIQLTLAWEENWAPKPVIVAAFALLLVFFALSTRPLRIATRGGRRPTLLLAVAAVITLAFAAFSMVWLVPVWLGIVSPFLSRRVFWIMAAVVTGLTFVYVAILGGLPFVLITMVLTLIVTGGTLANVRIWRIAQEAYAGQEAKAALAVSEERLRFARDLNDLLGQSLADIAAGAGRAETTLGADPERAAAEMLEVRDLARRSLREVRTAVQNYRALDLGEVLASVRAVLEAADVHCAIDTDDTGDLPAEARTLLAAVVREGATNILKHSTAQRCTITIKNGVLEMSNDGISPDAGEPGGLRGLSQRLSAAGGTLSAGAADGVYLLRAAV